MIEDNRRRFLVAGSAVSSPFLVAPGATEASSAGAETLRSGVRSSVCDSWMAGDSLRGRLGGVGPSLTSVAGVLTSRALSE